MAIALRKKNANYDIVLNNDTIIGVMGKDYDKFLASFKGNISIIRKEDTFFTDNVLTEIALYYQKKDIKNVLDALLREFNLDKNFLNMKISDLSSGERHILKYLLALIENKKILIIDEPFLDIDYTNKKKIITILKRIVMGNYKTIIIGSKDSNVIYSLCKNILLIKDNDYVYGDINKIFQDKDVLEKYDIELPLIMSFVNLAKDKGILINYSSDIRDLIKDVYKSV